MKKLLVLWLAAALLTAAGCGRQEQPQPPKTPPAEVTETIETRPRSVESLPEAFPMRLHFSSGAGGWQTVLDLQRDGSFTGEYRDSDMGSTGTDFPNGTAYLCAFEGRFGDFRTVDGSILTLTLEELTALTTEEEVWYEEGVRYIGSAPYGLVEGAVFLLYPPETPVAGLEGNALSGWPLMEEDTDTLGCWGLSDPARQQTFFDWSHWFPEGEPEPTPSPEGTGESAAEAAQQTGPQPPAEPEEAEPAESPEQAPEPEQAPAPMAVYEVEGIRIRLPAEVIPQLLVEVPEVCPEESPHGMTLMTVHEKASVEAAEADFGSGEGTGFLFGISRLDRVGFENLMQYDIPGCAVFATDGTDYYAVTTATDVQFYRSGDAFHDEAAWADWEALYALTESVPADILEQNDLTPCSHRDLYHQAFTYEGNHVYVNYYPYFTVDGSHDNFETLVLSQPAAQGPGGIWCVERMVDPHGNTYLIFPGQDVPAAAWYAARQTAHDEGTESHLATPLRAAEDFLRSGGWFSGELAEGSLEETSSMDEGYIDANRKLDRILPGLLTGREVEAEEILACLAAFRGDTWAFMGRSYYGSDWWPPLLTAVESVAIGEDQEARCAALQNFYLTSYGRYEEALRPLLLAQFESDPEAANAALALWSEAQQARLRAALAD